MQDTEGVPAQGLQLRGFCELFLPSLSSRIMCKEDETRRRRERGKHSDRSSPEAEQTVQESLLMIFAVLTSRF